MTLKDILLFERGEALIELGKAQMEMVTDFTEANITRLENICVSLKYIHQRLQWEEMGFFDGYEGTSFPIRMMGDYGYTMQTGDKVRYLPNVATEDNDGVEPGWFEICDQGCGSPSPPTPEPEDGDSDTAELPMSTDTVDASNPQRIRRRHKRTTELVKPPNLTTHKWRRITKAYKRAHMIAYEIDHTDAGVKADIACKRCREKKAECKFFKNRRKGDGRCGCCLAANTMCERALRSEKWSFG